MKSTQAWGWLTAGVLALGLNGIYQDSGADWLRRLTNRVSDQTGMVWDLASGRTDRFVAVAQSLSNKNEAAACRWQAAAARVQAKMARTENGFARIQALSARQEAHLARVQSSRARIGAVRAQLAMTDLASVRLPVVCPRVRVSVPRIDIPEIRVPMARVPLPVIKGDPSGRGPI